MSAARRRTSTSILAEALEHLEFAQRYAAGDLADQMVVDAVCMRLSAAIESLSTLQASERDALFGAEWPLMWGMRNRIAHGYMLVDASIVRSTMERDVPAIIERVEAALSEA